jgi:hypothetical protein
MIMIHKSMTAQALVNKIENHFYDRAKYGRAITKKAVFSRLICQILF